MLNEPIWSTTKSTWSGAGTRSASDRAWASLQAHHVWHDMTKSARHDTAQPRPQPKCHHLTLRPHTLTHPRPHSVNSWLRVLHHAVLTVVCRVVPRCCSSLSSTTPQVLTVLNCTAAPHRLDSTMTHRPPPRLHSTTLFCFTLTPTPWPRFALLRAPWIQSGSSHPFLSRRLGSKRA
jgi:hypothetical protein